jgi:hypothetical protein
MKILGAVTALLMLGAGSQAVPELTAAKVAKLPALDGKADDEAWKSAKELVVKTGLPLEDVKSQVTLKAVHDGDSICFLAVWPDETENKTHKLKSWSLSDEKYVVFDDAEIEDAFTFGFPLEGKFDPDMLAAHESKWDVWDWGAFRSSGGFAKDKYHLHTKQPVPGLKGKQFSARDENPIFITRVYDEGTPPWKEVTAPAAKGPEKVPSYALQAPTGSAADVQVQAKWADNKWTVEFKRKLKTGQKDDAAFDLSKPIEFAIATFDSVEKAEHLVSPKLLLKFAK